MVSGRVLVGLATVTACGGSAPPPVAPADEQGLAARDAFVQMAEFRDDMCACHDKPCADQVSERMAIWGRMMARRGGAPRRTAAEQHELAQTAEALAKCLAAALPPPPPPPRAPETLPAAAADAAAITVSPEAFDARRVSGNALIVPDDDVLEAFARTGRTRLITTIKLCMDSDGNVTRWHVLKSSGYASYDAKLLREIAGWKYTPFVADGVRQHACTVTTFLYSQKPAAPTAP